MMRCIGNTWMCTVLIFAVVGCMQIDPNIDSGYSRLFLSKEGAQVGESISKVSRNGKWYFGVDIDKDATFGALWNVIEDRWEVAECEWSVKCNGRNDDDLKFRPGDECDRMYGSLVRCRHVDVEMNVDGRVRISEEIPNPDMLVSASVCVLFRFPRSTPIAKMLAAVERVLSQYKSVAIVFVKPIDIPAHGECVVPWLNHRNSDD